MLHQALLWGALACAALAANPAAAQAVFKAPPELPAQKTPWALRSPYTALALAGTRIVAAGQRGHILYSDDGGTSWTQATVPVSSDLTALSFANARQGWAVGHEGVILHTQDGGATWSRQADAARENDRAFLDVWFEDEKKGYAIGAFGLLLRTDDGGNHWAPFEAVDNPKALHLYAMRPAGGTLFIVGEQGLVLRLDREGKRFAAVNLPYQGSLFGVVGTPGMVLAYGLRGNAWRSTDGGASWTQVDTGISAGIAAGTVREDGAVLLASQAGHLLLSTDQGVTFRRVQRQGAAPVFALAGAGASGVAVAGIGGVRMEALP